MYRLGQYISRKVGFTSNSQASTAPATTGQEIDAPDKETGDTEGERGHASDQFEERSEPGSVDEVEDEKDKDSEEGGERDENMPNQAEGLSELGSVDEEAESVKDENSNESEESEDESEKETAQAKDASESGSVDEESESVEGGDDNDNESEQSDVAIEPGSANEGRDEDGETKSTEEEGPVEETDPTEEPDSTDRIEGSEPNSSVIDDDSESVSEDSVSDNSSSQNDKDEASTDASTEDEEESEPQRLRIGILVPGSADGTPANNASDYEEVVLAEISKVKEVTFWKINSWDINGMNIGMYDFMEPIKMIHKDFVPDRPFRDCGTVKKLIEKVLHEAIYGVRTLTRSRYKAMQLQGIWNDKLVDAPVALDFSSALDGDDDSSDDDSDGSSDDGPDDPTDIHVVIFFANRYIDKENLQIDGKDHLDLQVNLQTTLRAHETARDVKKYLMQGEENAGLEGLRRSFKSEINEGGLDYWLAVKIYVLPQTEDQSTRMFRWSTDDIRPAEEFLNRRVSARYGRRLFVEARIDEDPKREEKDQERKRKLENQDYYAKQGTQKKQKTMEEEDEDEDEDEDEE